MSAGHTPGPWAAGVRVGGFIDITHSSNKPGDITRALCRVQSRITWAAESMANARLIAAAPDMLEVLIEVDRENSAALASMKDDDIEPPNWFVDQCQKIKDAITKATRESA